MAFSSLLCVAHAADFTVYRVVNVRAGNALNVRAENDAQSADIGSASPGAKMYVVGFDGPRKWAKVKWDGGYGWVSANFLSPERASDAAVDQIVALQSRQAEPDFSAAQLAAASEQAEQANTPPSTAALRDLDDADKPSISCSGRGPNWALTLNRQGALVFQAPDQSSLYANARWRQSVSNPDSYAFTVADVRGTLVKGSCDGQSGQWQLQLQTNGLGGYERLNGCCQRLD